MKFLPLAAAVFIPAIAFAQTPTYTSTVDLLAEHNAQCEQLATAQYNAFAKQVADLTKERDDLKAKVTPDAPKVITPTPSP